MLLGARASKINAVDLDAFAFINYPYIAILSETGITISHIPKRLVEDKPLTLDVAFDSNIVVFKVFPGMEPSLLDIATSSGISGIV